MTRLAAGARRRPGRRRAGGAARRGPRRPAAPSAGIACFGPAAAAARLEGSKAFAKSVMAGGRRAHRAASGLRHGRGGAGRDRRGGRQRRDQGRRPGRRQGRRRVLVDAPRRTPPSRRVLVDGRFGAVRRRVLIEERLEGEELSLLALCDGERVLPLAPARDYKRARRRRRGPEHRRHGLDLAGARDRRRYGRQTSSRRVHRPVVNELARRGSPFRGCLYAGLMLTADGPAGDRVQRPLRRPRGAGDPAPHWRRSARPAAPARPRGTLAGCEVEPAEPAPA